MNNEDGQDQKAEDAEKRSSKQSMSEIVNTNPVFKEYVQKFSEQKIYAILCVVVFVFFVTINGEWDKVRDMAVTFLILGICFAALCALIIFLRKKMRSAMAENIGAAVVLAGIFGWLWYVFSHWRG